MSTRRTVEGLVLVCDECNVETTPWASAVWRPTGWETTKRDDGSLEHLCGECQICGPPRRLYEGRQP